MYRDKEYSLYGIFGDCFTGGRVDYRTAYEEISKALWRCAKEHDDSYVRLMLKIRRIEDALGRQQQPIRLAEKRTVSDYPLAFQPRKTMIYSKYRTPSAKGGYSMQTHETYEFEAAVVGGVIRVPDNLKDRLPAKVKVTVTAESKGPIIIPAGKSGPGELTLDDFSALKIDTKGWKFDREEANERR